MKIKIGLIIDEFFGGAGTQYGGYGKLARDYICKYLQGYHGGVEIEIDVLLGIGKSKVLTEKYSEDGIKLYKLPREKFFAWWFLKRKKYDFYLSIELTYSKIMELERKGNKKLLLWIQDPRPMYEWDEINTVKLFPEPSYYNQKVYNEVHLWNSLDRVKFLTQANDLTRKAIDLYQLPKDIVVDYIPNPIDIDYDFDVKTYPKKNQIIFLGRIDSVKRGWLFCEIAKKMPEYEFYVLGKFQQKKARMSEILKPYMELPNLHFVGHVGGEEKNQLIKDSKILINTSIHEALPVSFLEALSYGTLLVSNRNPDGLTSKFGIWVGEVLGDGFDKVPLYVEAVRELILKEDLRMDLSIKAIEYVKQQHSVELFRDNMVKHFVQMMENKDNMN
ncbi:glycosyltransferase family 4 protein [Ignatzschineria sp. LJL83]